MAEMVGVVEVEGIRRWSSPDLPGVVGVEGTPLTLIGEVDKGSHTLVVEEGKDLSALQPNKFQTF